MTIRGVRESENMGNFEIPEEPGYRFSNYSTMLYSSLQIM